MAACGGFQLIRLLGMKFLPLLTDIQTSVASSEVYSVGIIGGADGPTAVFVTQPVWASCVLPCILVAVGLFGFFRLRKK